MNALYGLIVKQDVLAIVDAGIRMAENDKTKTALKAIYGAIAGIQTVHVFEAGDVNVITGSIEEVERLLKAVRNK